MSKFENLVNMRMYLGESLVFVVTKRKDSTRVREFGGMTWSLWDPLHSRRPPSTTFSCGLHNSLPVWIGGGKFVTSSQRVHRLVLKN